MMPLARTIGPIGMSRKAPGPSILVYDTFTGADNTYINSRLPDVNRGTGWVFSPANLQCTIQTNRLRISNGIGICKVDSGKADCVITCDLPVLSGQSGVAFRVTSSTVGWYAYAQSGLGIRIWELGVGARATQSGTVSGGGTMTITLSGTSIVVTYQTLTVNYTSSAQQAVTTHGLYANSSTVRFDNFKVVG